MITAFGAARLGRDASFVTPKTAIRSPPRPASTIGKRGGEGNRQTTWIDGSLWGKRADH